MVVTLTDSVAAKITHDHKVLELLKLEATQRRRRYAGTLGQQGMQKIFSENQVSESEVVLKAVRGARKWQASQALLPTSLNVNRAQVPQIEMEGFRGFRVFVDVAWNPSSRSGGFGWTFVNASNTSQENFSEANDSITSALVAEAETLLSALKHALQLNRKELQVFSNSQSLVKLIQDEAFHTELSGVRTSEIFGQVSPLYLSVISLVKLTQWLTY